MTRSQQNALILSSITDELKDKPNIQDIITAKFNEWFRALVKTGQELMMQGQVPTQAAAGGGAPPEEGAPA